MKTIDRQLVHEAPGTMPLVGHVPPFLRDRLGFLSRCARSKAAAVRIRLDTDAYLLLDAEDIKHVLEANHTNYAKSEKMVSSRGKQLSGYGLLTASGQKHLDMRRALQPIFAATGVSRFAEGIVSEADRMLGTWPDGQDIDLAAALMDLAQCINGRTLFGVDYRSEHAALAEAVRERRRYMHLVFSSVLPFSQSLPSRARARFHKAQGLIEREVTALIAQRRPDPSKFPDMLARLTEVAMLDDAAVREEAVTTAVTGYETIGEAWAWTCLLLMQNPRICDLLVGEIRRVLAGRSPAPEDLPRLSLVEQTINESMRLYPPTWIYVRRALEPDRLPSGVRLPRRAKVYICPWVIHRSERYFEEPLKFDPSRFETEARRHRPKYAFFPFGGGPRVCIGQALAKMQMPLVLAMLLERFSFTLLPGPRITPEPRITLSPSPGIRVRLHRRA